MAGNDQPDGFELVGEEIEPTDMRPYIEWHGPVVCELPNDFVIRALQFPEDYITEGILMGHCLGVIREHYKDYHCFHLESKDKLSHVTIVCWPKMFAPERVYEIRGRNNMAPQADYRVMIQPWLERENIQGDDVHGYGSQADDDTEYHEKGIIRHVITGLEGLYH